MKFISEDLLRYSVSMSSTPGPTCQEIEGYTLANVPMPQMLAGPLENSLLGFLILLTQPQTIVELGTYTGYSSLAMAELSSPRTKIFTFDINPDHLSVAKAFWKKSPHGHKIHASLTPALSGLSQLVDQIDLAFVDADKKEYPEYVKTIVSKLAPKGILVVDNVLWSGKVLSPPFDEETAKIHEATQWAKSNPDLYTTLLPLRDGIMLIQKRAE